MDAIKYQPDPMLKDDPSTEREIHLQDYLRILHDRRKMIYTVFAVIMIFTVIFTFSRIPMYEANAKLIIEQGEKNPLLSELGGLGSDPVFLAAQTEIIKSTAVGMKVVEMLNLDITYDDYIEQQKYGFSLIGLRMLVTNLLKSAIEILGMAEARNFNPANRSKAENRAIAEKIAGKLSEEISVRSNLENGIVTLNYLSPNPVLASKIVNAVVEAYIKKNFDMKVEASNQALEWMITKADEEKANLERAERTLQEYMKENDIITIENRETVTPQKLAEINSQLIKTQSRRRDLHLVYKRIKGLPPDLKGAESIEVIASDTAIQSLRNQIFDAEKKIVDLSKTYGPKHPVMKQAKVDLGILMQQRSFEIKRVMEAVINEYDLILESEREYEKLLKETKQDTVKINEKLIQYNILKREVETIRQLYNALSTKIKEQNLADQAQSIKVWVIEKAKTPKLPAKPNKILNIMLGFALSLFIGVTIAFLLEHLDDTIKHPDDVENRLDLPLLGTVTTLESKMIAPEMATLENLSPAFAESFKSIRTAVLLSFSNELPKCLLVTSMAPSEGKTTTAVNLAVSMAQAGWQVLLIDADMRKPRIHNILELSNNKGLSSYLTGSAGGGIIQKSQEENLEVITSGPIPPNPSELLISELTQKLIKLKEANYDLIIFDSPPVLTVSDGLILGKLVDNIILVARANKTTWTMFKKGRRTLANIGGKILGVIINGKEVEKKDYHYYYNHYYRSYDKEDYL